MIRRCRRPSALTLLLVFGLLLTLSPRQASPQDSAAKVSDEARHGLSQLQSGDLHGAIKFLRERVRVAAGDADAWHYLGLALLKGGDSKGAQQAFGTAVSLRPEFVAARTGLAYALLMGERLNEARKEAEHVLAQNKRSDEAHCILGTVFLRQHDYLKALKEADAALEIQPTFRTALDLKSQLLFTILTSSVDPVFLGSHDEATKRAAASDNNGALGADLMSLQNLGSGFCCFDTSAAHLQVGRINQAKRFADAAAIYRESIKRTPNLPEAVAWQEELETLVFWEKYFDPYKGAAVVKITNPKEVSSKPKILSKPEPAVSLDQVKTLLSARIVLIAVLAEGGEIKHILPLRPLRYDLAERAIEAARKMRFEPATKEGRPVSVVTLIEYDLKGNAKP